MGVLLVVLASMMYLHHVKKEAKLSAFEKWRNVYDEKHPNFVRRYRMRKPGVEHEQSTDTFDSLYEMSRDEDNESVMNPYRNRPVLDNQTVPIPKRGRAPAVEAHRLKRKAAYLPYRDNPLAKVRQRVEATGGVSVFKNRQAQIVPAEERFAAEHTPKFAKLSASYLEKRRDDSSSRANVYHL